MAKSTILTGLFSIAMLNYQKVYMNDTNNDFVWIYSNDIMT